MFIRCLSDVVPDSRLQALNGFIKRALEFRKEQEKELWSDSGASKDGGCGHAKCKKLGDVTTVNLTMQKAGVTTDGGQTYALNVIPTEASAGFDIRVTLDLGLILTNRAHDVGLILILGLRDCVTA